MTVSDATENKFAELKNLAEIKLEQLAGKKL